jgi:D-alanine transfer protein
MARQMEARYVHALAPEVPNRIKNLGSALQAEAFRNSDLLPIYGSSELDSFVGPFHAYELFKTYPTGFQVFPVGTAGTTPMIILQDLAAVGPELRGKKVAIAVSPTFVREPGPVRDNYYTGNFSRLHAFELALNAMLSPRLKQDAAQRMLEYHRTVDGDPLLRAILRRLASDSWLNQVGYDALYPLGMLQTAVLRLQDHWETLVEIREHPELRPDVPRHAERLDWSALEQQALQLAIERSSSNDFGVDDDYWERNGKEFVDARNRMRDGTYLRSLREDMDWTDMDVLFRGMQELGVQSVAVSVPIKGIYYDYWGVSAQARRQYYNRLQEVAKRDGIRLIDFRQYDTDRYFTSDDRSHPSQTGWLQYDRILDAFYHGTLR